MTAEADGGRAVTFRLGDDLYAVDVAAVRRVLRHVVARPVPRLPAWIEGVIEHEGEVVPVVDLRRRVGASVEPPGPRARLLLVSVRDETCAVVVDQVIDVRPYAAQDLAVAPVMVRGLAGDFVRGVFRREAKLVVMLDLAALLSAAERNELSILEAAHA